jgi:16S rRNA (guanine527-N7)-methyltransferase
VPGRKHPARPGAHGSAGRKRPARPGAHGSVSRETDPQIELLLEALAAEPDPHTSVSEPERAREVHVADSLSGLEVPSLASARRIADVGAGAGFPGLVLAVALPRARVDLIESVGRRAAVIDRLIQAAKVENARSVVARAEEWARLPVALGGGREAYDAVTARAVAALPVLVEYAAPLLRASGVFVAWKGRVGADELRLGRGAADEVGLSLEDVLSVEPFSGARDRHLCVFRKVSATPERFPRRAGMAVKRPLGGDPSRLRANDER